MTRFHALFPTVLLLVSAAAAHAAPLTLVQHGEARAGILVQADAEKPRHAAEALQTYIHKMTGSMLPLIEEGEQFETQPSVVIHVGRTGAAAAIAPNIPAGFHPAPRPEGFDGEGFILKTHGNLLIVAGNDDGPYQGSIYGAYALLHRLGCRWYFPGEWGQIVPERASITIEDLDEVSRPDFSVRSVSLGGWLPSNAQEKNEYELWQLRVGMTPNHREFYPIAGDGFLAYLVNPNEYFDDHPEYFAMGKDGKRQRGRTERHTMLCLSNPAVFDVAVQTLKKMMSGEKPFSFFTTGMGISPPDGVPYCYCPNCQTASQNFNFPRYAHRTFQSEEYFQFAAKLAREFPDIYIRTAAYALREIAPQGVDLPPNVAVSVAPISCDVLHPNDSHLWRRRDFIRNLKRWATLSNHITIYDYNPGMLLGNWLPERDAENFAINAPIYRAIGVKGVQAEGRKAFMQTWISNYVRARFLWDADSDLDAIKTDFYTTFFGPNAGPHVRAWWDACAEALVRNPMQAHEDWLINHIYTEEFVRSIMPHIEAARAAAATPQQHERVEAVALIADHLLAYAEYNAAEQQLDYVRAAQAADRMYQREVELHEVHNFLHEYHNAKHAHRPHFPAGRADFYRALADKTTGGKGDLIAPVPIEASFSRDPFNEGIVGNWYDPGYDDSGWETRNTFHTWDQQEEPLTSAGHDYDGYGWYRFSFDVPAALAGRKVHLFLGGVINEGWIWANGRYVGHKEHQLWWSSTRHSAEFDISEQVKFGQTNTIAIRVLNDAEIGGLYRRGFIWAEQPEADAPTP